MGHRGQTPARLCPRKENASAVIASESLPWGCDHLMRALSHCQLQPASTPWSELGRRAVYEPCRGRGSGMQRPWPRQLLTSTHTAGMQQTGVSTAGMQQIGVSTAVIKQT
eukprot:284236-Chlamydomonas_euryale.AAC.1